MSKMTAVRIFYFPHKGPSINYVTRKGGVGKYKHTWGREREALVLRVVTQELARGDHFMEKSWEFCRNSVQQSAKCSDLIRSKGTKQRDVIFKGVAGFRPAQQVRDEGRWYKILNSSKTYVIYGKPLSPRGKIAYFAVFCPSFILATNLFRGCFLGLFSFLDSKIISALENTREINWWRV